VVLSLLALTLILGVLSDYKKEGNFGDGKHHGEHHGEHHGNNGYNHEPTKGGAATPQLESSGLTHPVDQSNSTVHPHAMEGHHAHCIWMNEAGVKYDLNRVLPNKQIDLAFIFSGNDSYNLFIRPCGPVVTSVCPPNASVCLVKDQKDGISFGTYLNKQFAQAADNESVEVTYGDGELCGNGVPRKSMVTYTCTNGSTRIISVKSDDDECFLEINIGLSERDCPTNLGKIDCHLPEKQRHRSNVFTIVMFSSMALLMSFFLCFALCACRRSRRLRALSHRKVSKKIPSIPYEAVPVQLVPGGFAPVDPYTMQGYPMISLVAPTQFPKGETV